jgi:BirA family biotin operon repressor/biotin-[acetyl-CoA-carboxylase] ligase
MCIYLYNPIEPPIGTGIHLAPSSKGLRVKTSLPSIMSPRDEDTVSGLDEADLRTALEDRADVWDAIGDLVVRGSLPSTSTTALEDPREPLLVVSLEQTEGRGRHGASWTSPRGGLYLSYVPPRDLLPERLTDITLLAALSVAGAVDVTLASAGVGGVHSLVKWPNDVMVGDGKVAGVLVQAMTVNNESGRQPHRVVIGIGLNANASVEVTPSDDHLPGEWPVHAVSLREITGHPVKLADLLIAIVSGLVERLRTGLDTAALAEYRSRCITLGKRVAFVEGGNRLHGTAMDITDPGGALVLRLEGGALRELTSGDIRHVREVRG